MTSGFRILGIRVYVTERSKASQKTMIALAAVAAVASAGAV
jgi:hypothetical protein